MFSLSFVSRYFLISSLIFSVTYWLFSSICLASTCLCVLQGFFPVVISNLLVLWLEKMLDMISIFLNLPRLDL